jgi:cell shape-determining protein MreC
MDWELYERYRATVMLIAVAALSILLLAFQRSAFVRHVRTALVTFTLPTERFLSRLKAPKIPAIALPDPGQTGSPPPSTTSAPLWAFDSEQRRALQVLSSENDRLHDILDLQKRRWPRAVAAHVVGRDPQRWFQELVLDKGSDAGAAVDNPVVAIVEGREGLVGRIVEASPSVSRVMLVQDSLSAVTATVLGASSEDGIVEGNNGHDLWLKFLDRGSRVKIGDAVVTSGLGKAFPEGIPIGWVEEITLDARQLFLQARLRPAVKTNQVHVVLILAAAAQ